MGKLCWEYKMEKFALNIDGKLFRRNFITEILWDCLILIVLTYNIIQEYHHDWDERLIAMIALPFFAVDLIWLIWTKKRLF